MGNAPASDSFMATAEPNWTKRDFCMVQDRLYSLGPGRHSLMMRQLNQIAPVDKPFRISEDGVQSICNSLISLNNEACIIKKDAATESAAASAATAYQMISMYDNDDCSGELCDDGVESRKMRQRMAREKQAISIEKLRLTLQVHHVLNISVIQIFESVVGCSGTIQPNL